MHCGKLVFRTEDAARQAGRSVVKAGKAEHTRPYFCHRCRAWHITSHTLKEYREAAVK